MTFTLSISWWWIPAIVTFLAFIAPSVFVRDSGLGTGIVCLCVWALGFFVSTIFWIIFAILK